MCCSHEMRKTKGGIGIPVVVRCRLYWDWMIDYVGLKAICITVDLVDAILLNLILYFKDESNRLQL